MTRQRFFLTLSGAVGSVAFGLVASSWALIVIGVAAIMLLVVNRFVKVKTENYPTVVLWTTVVTGLLGMGGLAFGIYAAVAVESTLTGVVILVGLLFPSAYFLLLAWLGIHLALTGKRVGQADGIDAFFARLNRPLWRRNRR